MLVLWSDQLKYDPHGSGLVLDADDGRTGHLGNV